MNLSPLRIVINGVDQYSKQFNTVSKEAKKMASGLTSVGSTLTASITAPLTLAAGAAVKLSTDFNKSMANVASLIPGTGDRIYELKDGVQALSIEMGKSTDDLAGGLYQVISAFGDTDDAMGQLKITSMAAKAGLATTEEALSLLSAVTKGYGDTSTEAMNKSADLALTTVKLGQTTFPELAASMGKVVPVAQALGISQEELFAGFATLTGVTGNAAEVSTQLSAVMVAMLKPSTQLSKLTKKLGYSSASAMLQQEGLAGSLNILSTATGGSADAMGMLLGSKEAVVGALSLTGAQAGNMAQKFDAMKNSAGAMGEAFGAQTKGINAIGFRMEQSQQRITVALQRIGDMLLPLVAQIMDAVMPMVDMLSNMGPAAMGTVIALAAMAAAIGPLLVAAGALISAWGSIAGAIAGAGGVVALLSNPIGWIVLGIGALVVICILLRDQLKPLVGFIGGALQMAFIAIKVVLALVMPLFQSLWAIVKNLITILQPLVIIWLIFQGIMAAFTLGPIIAAFTALVLVFRFLAWGLKIITDGFVFLLKIVGDFFSMIDKAMGGPITGMIKMIKDLLGSVMGGITVDGAPGANGTPATATTAPVVPPGLPGLGGGGGAPAGAAGTALLAGAGAAGAASTITVDFKNLPTGVTVTPRGNGAKVTADNGPIMAT